MAEGATPRTEPRWPREFVEQGLDEAALYLKTTFAFVSHPARFILRWADGSQVAMNPVVVMGTSAALLATVRQLTWPAQDSGSQSLWASFVDGLLPYTYYAALALACHAVLRGAGSKRAWSSSVAVALFAGGGPITFSQLISDSLLAVLNRAGRFHAAAPGRGLAFRLAHVDFFVVLSVLVAGVVAFVICVTAALAALHRKPAWAIAIMVLLAMLLIGSVPGHERLRILHVGFSRGHSRPGIPVPDVYLP